MPTDLTLDRDSVAGASQSWRTAIPYTLASSLLFILAYPPWNLGAVTAWIVLVPLMAAIRAASLSQAAWLGWVFGLVANLGVFAWMTEVPGIRWYHLALLDGYLGLYPALWALLAVRWLRGTPWAHISLACAWVVLEYVRGHAGFLALPWITLAQSQVDNLSLLQTASWLGESAVTFLVVLGNLAVWNLMGTMITRSAILCAFPLLGFALGGFILIGSGADRNPTTLVAALRTDFPAPRMLRPDPEARFDAQLEFLQQHIPAGVTLVVMPESSIVNPDLFPQQVERLHRFVRQNQLTVVAGVAETTKFDQLPARPEMSGPLLRSGVWFISPERELPQHYVKSLLVPFAEYAPMNDVLAWPTWLIPPTPEVEQGPAPHSVLLPNNVRAGILMCWESLFAEHARVLVEDHAAILFMLANEGWFGNSAAGALHNLTARMRAVETSRSVVVSSNMGPSLVIDLHGRVRAESPSAGMYVVLAEVPLATERSIYLRVGDVFVFGCGVVVLFCAAFIWGRRQVLSIESPGHLLATGRSNPVAESTSESVG
jgi:apolipoprotein N-acyltransferase